MSAKFRGDTNHVHGSAVRSKQCPALITAKIIDPGWRACLLPDDREKSTT